MRIKCINIWKALRRMPGVKQMLNNISYYQPSSFLKCFIVRQAAFHLSEPWDIEKWWRERNAFIKAAIKIGKDVVLPGTSPSAQPPAPIFSFPIENGELDWEFCMLRTKRERKVVMVNHPSKAGFLLEPASSFGFSLGLEHLQQWEAQCSHPHRAHSPVGGTAIN